MAFTVYIVEDHAVVREGYATLLSRHPGLEVLGASASAEAALEELPGCLPDLVLIDVSLPGMNGILLLQHLRRRCPGLTALMVSGHAQDLYERDAEAAGASGYVMKHHGPRALLAAIERLMPAPQA